MALVVAAIWSMDAAMDGGNIPLSADEAAALEGAESCERSTLISVFTSVLSSSSSSLTSAFLSAFTGAGGVVGSVGAAKEGVVGAGAKVAPPELSLSRRSCRARPFGIG